MDTCAPEVAETGRRGEATAAAFRRELAERTRRTGIGGGVVGAVAYLAWGGADRVLEPAHAAEFWPVRVTVAMLLAVGTVLLATRLVRGSAAEWTTFSFVVAVQTGIAWMIPRVDTALTAYVHGYTLAIYGSALLIEWSWTYNLAAIAMSWVALAVAAVSAPEPMSGREIAMCVSFLGSSSAISLVGNWMRYRISRSEFAARTEAEGAKAEAEREREQNRDLLRRLDHLSGHDPLTDLPNRRLLDDTLARELAQAERDGASLVLVLLDIDHFKRLNDTHGHQAGDRVLRAVAAALAAQVRRGDLAARYGGEEFALVLPGMRADDVLRVVDDLRSVAHAASRDEDPLLAVTLSAGAAVYPEHGPTVDELLRAADVALYEAKNGGRDQARLASLDTAPERSPDPLRSSS